MGALTFCFGVVETVLVVEDKERVDSDNKVADLEEKGDCRLEVPVWQAGVEGCLS